MVKDMMEFPGVMKKQHAEIPKGQLKKKCNFQVFKKNSCRIAIMGLGC